MAKRKSGPVIPWELGTQEINSFEESFPQLAEILRNSKERYHEPETQETIDFVQVWLEKLVDAKAPKKDLDTLTSPDDIFNYLLNTIVQRHSENHNLKLENKSLGLELKRVQRDYADLVQLKKNKELAEEKRKLAEKDFFMALSADVIGFFSMFDAYDTVGKQGAVSRYKTNIQRELKNLSQRRTKELGLPQKEDYGYSLEERVDDFRITFTDADLALLFYKKFTNWKKIQWIGFAQEYEKLRVEKERFEELKAELDVSKTYIDGEISQELVRHERDKLNIKTFADDCLALSREEFLKKYGPQFEDYLKIVKAMEKLEKALPKYFRNLPSTRAKISYFAKGSDNIAKTLRENQARMEENIAEVEAARREKAETEAAIQDLESRMIGYTGEIFNGFKILGDYLKKKGIEYEFGFEKVNGKKPIEYFDVIKSELVKVSQALREIVKAKEIAEIENKELKKYRFLHDEIAEGARYLKARLEELQDPEQEELRVALFNQIKGVRHTFLNLIEGFGVKGEFEYLNTERKLPAAVSYEKLIEEHYLGILDEAITLTEAEFAGFQKMQDSLVDVTEQKQRLAARYQCETFDELSEKVEQISKHADIIQARKDLDKRFDEFRKKAGVKPKTRETADQNLGILKNRIEYCGEEYQEENDGPFMHYLESKEAKRNLRNTYRKMPQHEDVQGLQKAVLADVSIMEAITFEYAALEQREGEFVKAAAQLNPEKDTPQKVASLVSTIRKQITKYQNQEVANQELISSEEYQKAAENFSVAAKVGEFLGVEIHTPADLMTALQNERVSYANLAETYRKYQELKKGLAQRTGS